MKVYYISLFLCVYSQAPVSLWQEVFFSSVLQKYTQINDKPWHEMHADACDQNSDVFW